MTSRSFRLRSHVAMLRAWAVILAVSALYAALGCWLASETGLAWWWGLVPVAVMLVFGEVVLLVSRDHPLGGREYVELTRELGPRAHEALDRLCALSGSPRPELRLLDLGHANALTLTSRRGTDVIYVSPALVTQLEPPELEAVLAHEMAHIAHRDQRLLLFATGMTRWPLYLPMAILPFAEWFDSGVVALARRCGRVWEPISDEAAPKEPAPAPERPGNPVLRLLAHPFLWALAAVRVLVTVPLMVAKIPLMILGALAVLPGLPAVFVLNRQRELAADRAAAELTGTPSTLASALDRLREHRERTPRQDLRAANVSALAIIPLDGKGGGGWLSTHPSLSRRMDGLREQARNMARSGT